MTYNLDNILELNIINPSWEVLDIDRSIVIIKMTLGAPNNPVMSVTLPLYGYDGSDENTWVENKLKELEA